MDENKEIEIVEENIEDIQTTTNDEPMENIVEYCEVENEYKN